MRRVPNALLLAIACLALPARAQTESPSTIAYQGVLADATGQPIADGSYTITLSLFDVATGGSASYAETHSVTTDAGVFAALIGGGTVTVGDFDVEAFDDAMWVEFSVGATTLSPRTAMQAVPYARSLTPGARIVGAADYTIEVIDTNPSGFSSAVRAETKSTFGQGVYGLATALSGTNYGVRGESASTTGRGVYGVATALSGANAGVRGESASTTGRGVYGVATAFTGTNHGVYGLSTSTEGRGVFGWGAALSGANYGVRGETASTSGQGVSGVATTTTGATIGVSGQSASSTGRGVFGEATATSGTNFGVRGESASTTGRGVYGLATAFTGAAYGVFGLSTSTEGRGVFGWAAALSGDIKGVAGQSSSTSGSGVYGEATALTGTTYGVRGEVDSPDGYAGYFTGGRGIFTENNGGSGVTTATIFAENLSVGAGIAGWFESNGTDVTLGLDQAGSGDLIKAYTSDGLRFRVSNAGNVTADGSFTGSGADFAEFFPLKTGAAVRPGDVVGITGGRAGLATDGAEQVMIVSGNPAFVGNPDAAYGGALVALVGQVEVRLTASAAVGDLLVASGRGDGTARAVAPSRFNPATDGPVIGRVLTVVGDRAVALVGVDESAALRSVVARQQDEITSQQNQLTGLSADRDRQQAQIDALVRQLDALTLRTEQSLGDVSASGR